MFTIPNFLPDLLHGEKTRVWGDSVYSGQKQATINHVPLARDFTQAKGSRNRKLTEAELARNRKKSRIRARWEHQFGIIKRLFGFSKVRYLGLEKNAHCLFVACALSNLLISRKTLLKRSTAGLQVICTRRTGIEEEIPCMVLEVACQPGTKIYIANQSAIKETWVSEDHYQ